MPATSYTMGTYPTAAGTREVVLTRLPFPREDAWIFVDYVAGATGPHADLQVPMADVDFQKAAEIVDDYIAESTAAGRPAWR